MNNRVLLAAVASVMVGFAGGASALTLNFDNTTTNSSNAQHTGAAGFVEMLFSDVGGNIRVDMTVTNTTGDSTFGAGATVSKLTGFGFDFLDSTSWVGSISTGTYLDTVILDANAQPFGSLDVAHADNSNYNGGNANDALPQGVSDSMAFTLSDTTYDAAGLEAAMDAAFGSGTLQAAMRFQQVNAGAGSDKLDYTGSTPDPDPVPLPAAGWLMVAALGGLFAARRKRCG